MHGDDSTASSDRSASTAVRGDRGSLILELSVVVTILVVFVATALWAVAGVTTHAEAIGCEANRGRVEVALVITDSELAAHPADSSSNPNRDRHTAVATPQEYTSC